MINRKVAKALTYQYAALAIILIILAGGLVLLPKYEKNEKVSPEELLSNAINPERYVSTDALADIIITKDPSYLLIDVRDSLDFANYSIPGSINIPLKKLLGEEASAYIYQDQYDLIFISNDNFKSDQAWILCSRLGNKNLNVLKGGVNEWYHTIINPTEPTEEMPAEAFELYDTRKAASMYFGVAYAEQYKAEEKPVVKKAAPKKVVVPVKKKKKMPVEGGC